MERTVGIIGLGIMGGAIARNLVERGWHVLGHDIDEACRARAQECGVDVRATTDDVARQTPFVLTSLSRPSAALSVAHEIADAGCEPRIVAELSTFALDDKRAFAAILETAGHTALDCPLSGTGAQAQTRDLAIYASGRAQAIATMNALFSDFARKTVNLGAFGNGSRMKFVANLLVAVHNVASAEAMVLGMKAGLDPALMVEVIGAGAGASKVFELRAPMMACDNYEPATMRVSTWQKDMAVIGDFATDLGCDAPCFAATRPIYDAAMSLGLAQQDTAAVCRVLERSAGLQRS